VPLSIEPRVKRFIINLFRVVVGPEGPLHT
jgi:hypothetical protein